MRTHDAMLFYVLFCNARPEVYIVKQMKCLTPAKPSISPKKSHGKAHPHDSLLGHLMAQTQCSLSQRRGLYEAVSNCDQMMLNSPKPV